MLIRAGLLIDGTGNEPQSDCYIEIKEDIIHKIGKETDFTYTEIREVVDFSEYTLLPGLIDCHVHLFLEGISDLKARNQRWKDLRKRSYNSA